MEFSDEELKDILKLENSILPILDGEEPYDIELTFPKIQTIDTTRGKEYSTMIKNGMSKSKISEPILDIENYSYEQTDKNTELPKLLPELSPK